MGSVPRACPSPPCWHPAGSSPAHGMWLGPKGSDKIKARGCPRGWGALNPDNGWHPNTRGWQRWPWWVTATGSACPWARNPRGGGRKFSGPMGRVGEGYGARRCPVWWDTRDGPSLVGSTAGGSARGIGVQGGMEVAEDSHSKGPAVRQEGPQSRGRMGEGWGPASGTPRTQPGRSCPGGQCHNGTRPLCLGSGMRGGGSGSLPRPDLGGGVGAEGDGTSPGPGIGVKPIGLGCGALRSPEWG